MQHNLDFLRDYEVTEISEVISNKMLREYETILKRENHFDESDNVKIVIGIINWYSRNIQLRYTGHNNDYQNLTVWVWKHECYFMQLSFLHSKYGM